jgi:hypothetical protein
VRAELNAAATAIKLPEAPAYVIAAPDGALPPYYVIEPVAASVDVIDPAAVARRPGARRRGPRQGCRRLRRHRGEPAPAGAW